jgi:proline iminopeptidase
MRQVATLGKSNLALAFCELICYGQQMKTFRSGEDRTLNELRRGLRCAAPEIPGEITLLYPPLEPYWSGYLAVSEVHSLYLETSGNPAGLPVVFLHGGPGDGSKPGQRRYFDPAAYRIILFDQRGCGLSTPYASIEDNTTLDSVADLEKIREFLGVESWLVFGGSWGSTLALAYAQTHPARVRGLILWGIHLGRACESEWLYQQGASLLFPEAYAAFVAGLSAAQRGDVVGSYYALLTSPDRAIRTAAAEALSHWEMAVLRLPPFVPGPGSPEPAEENKIELPSESASALIGMHYQAHGCFLAPPDQLLAGVETIRHIPATIIEGADDLMCPPVTADLLHQRWPEAKYFIVSNAGHSSGALGIVDRLIEATDEFAQEIEAADRPARLPAPGS